MQLGPRAIVSFRDPATEQLYEGEDSKRTRRLLPRELHRKAREVLDRLNAAVSLESLSLPGLGLEKLRGDRADQHSIRINDQYRICFRWTDRGAEDIEIVDYH